MLRQMQDDLEAVVAANLWAGEINNEECEGLFVHIRQIAELEPGEVEPAGFPQTGFDSVGGKWIFGHNPDFHCAWLAVATVCQLHSSLRPCYHSICDLDDPLQRK